MKNEREATLEDLLRVVAYSMTEGKNPEEIDKLWRELKLGFNRNKTCDIKKRTE